MNYGFLKHTFDFLFSFIAFVLLLPLFLLLAVLLSIANRGNPFFAQHRPGRNGHIFKIIKFKTMNDRCDLEENLLPDAERLTTVGKIVRKTSLDEIPQLLNVIKGDMSLVGPRPLLVEYLPLYNKEQARRHTLRPGITGWAQVNGRNAITWKKKFEYDVWYVDNVSFSLDMKILFLTIFKAFKGEDVNSKGMATTEKFKGND